MTYYTLPVLEAMWKETDSLKGVLVSLPAEQHDRHVEKNTVFISVYTEVFQEIERTIFLLCSTL